MWQGVLYLGSDLLWQHGVLFLGSDLLWQRVLRQGDGLLWRKVLHLDKRMLLQQCLLHNWGLLRHNLLPYKQLYLREGRMHEIYQCLVVVLGYLRVVRIVD